MLDDNGPYEDQSATLVEQVMSSVRKQISSRQATPGVKLPSLRAMSQRHNVSKSTVVEAYDRLAAEGAIHSRPGSGFFVSTNIPPFAIADAGPDLDREVDPIWLARQSLEPDSYRFQPGCGWLPKSWMPEEEIRRALRNLARRDSTDLTHYGSPRGLLELRQLLSRRLADNGVTASAEQILLTDSGTHAIDLICRFLLEPGDKVLVDDPCYFNFHAMLRAHRIEVVSVPYTPLGPDLDAFEQVLEQHKPRVYITNSSVQNPTSASLSPLTAHRVLKLAEQHDLMIIEDDTFNDFEHTPSPRLAAFDGLERVIHIGSFSKTLSAATRCGFISARPDWIEGLVDLKLATSFSSSALSPEIILLLLKDGAYRKHITRLRDKLAKSMPFVVSQLAELNIKPWHLPTAGMFLWCELPNGIDAAKLARCALRDSVVLAPGNAFSQSQSAANFMRFNIAQSQDAQIYPLIRNAFNRLAVDH